MKRRLGLFALGCTLFGAGVATAQYPVMDMVAGRVIQKYQTATCEDLWAKRGQHNPEEQRVIGFLRQDPAMPATRGAPTDRVKSGRVERLTVESPAVSISLWASPTDRQQIGQTGARRTASTASSRIRATMEGTVDSRSSLGFRM